MVIAFFKCFFMIAVVCFYLLRSDTFILAQPSNDQIHRPLKCQFIFISLKCLAVPWQLGHGMGPCCAKPHAHMQAQEQSTLLQSPLSHRHDFQVLEIWYNLWTHLSLYEHSKS